MKLPFTHGIEMEFFITDKKGRILPGDQLMPVWERMFNKAWALLKELPSKAPPEIAKRIVSLSVEEVERHGKKIKYITITYDTQGKPVKVNIFGPDPNITQITWLLELVTPPAETLEELKFWVELLTSTARAALGGSHRILAIGFNPFEKEYRSGLTCGEHHHIGIQNMDERIAAYNVIRAFIPHLIALTANSPFMNQIPDGPVSQKLEGGRRTIMARCTKSIRLAMNTGQLGPEIPEYLPYLTHGVSRTRFAELVMRAIPEDRYIDIFPFTDYGTIEIRVFDSQFWLELRYAMVILLQAMALKGAKLVKRGNYGPPVSGHILRENRLSAINRGLLGKFIPDKSLTGEEGRVYNFDESGRPHGRLFSAVKSMLAYLAPELREMGVGDELDPVLCEVYGTDRFNAPIGPADYLLYRYLISGNSVSKVINEIAKGQKIVIGRPMISLKNALEYKPTGVAAKKTPVMLRSRLLKELRKKVKTQKKIRTTAKLKKSLAKKSKTKKISTEKKKVSRVVSKKVVPQRSQGVSIKPLGAAKIIKGSTTVSTKKATGKTVSKPSIKPGTLGGKSFSVTTTKRSRPTSVGGLRPAQQKIKLRPVRAAPEAPAKLKLLKPKKSLNTLVDPGRDMKGKGYEVKIEVPSVVCKQGVAIVTVKPPVLQASPELYVMIHGMVYKEVWHGKRGGIHGMVCLFESKKPGDHDVIIIVKDHGEIVFRVAKKVRFTGKDPVNVKITGIIKGIGESSVRYEIHASQKLSVKLKLYALGHILLKLKEFATKYNPSTMRNMPLRTSDYVQFPAVLAPQYALVLFIEAGERSTSMVYIVDISRIYVLRTLLLIDRKPAPSLLTLKKKTKHQLHIKVVSSVDIPVKRITLVARYIKENGKTKSKVLMKIEKKITLKAGSEISHEVLNGIEIPKGVKSIILKAIVEDKYDVLYGDYHQCEIKVV